jgi:DNA invertase Pin-like site-specific DNA recombinase
MSACYPLLAHHSGETAAMPKHRRDHHQPLRAALYLRVSTTGQTVANQERELEAVAERNGWTIAHVFKDAGISGAKGRDKRPGLDALLKGVARREFDIVAAWSVDRLGRSLQDLVALLGELHSKQVELYLHQQGIDTTTPAGKAMFGMMSVFAEFERAMIRERVMAGLARAKAQDRQLGRPRVAPEVEQAISVALKAGKGIVSIARDLGVGVSTVQRVKAELGAA